MLIGAFTKSCIVAYGCFRRHLRFLLSTFSFLQLITSKLSCWNSNYPDPGSRVGCPKNQREHRNQRGEGIQHPRPWSRALYSQLGGRVGLEAYRGVAAALRCGKGFWRENIRRRKENLTVPCFVQPLLCVNATF